MKRISACLSVLMLACIHAVESSFAGTPAPSHSPTAATSNIVVEIEALIQSAKEQWEAQDLQGALETARKAHNLSQETYGPEHEKSKQISAMIAAAQAQAAPRPRPVAGQPPSVGPIVKTYTYEEYLEAMEKESAKYLTKAYLKVETKMPIGRRALARRLVSGEEKILKVYYKGKMLKGDVDVDSYINGQYFPEEAAQDTVEQAATKMEAFIQSGKETPGWNAFDVKAQIPAADYRERMRTVLPRHAVTPTPEPTPFPMPPLAGAKLREAHEAWGSKGNRRAVNLGKEALHLMRTNAPNHPRLGEVEQAVKKAEETLHLEEAGIMATPAFDPGKKPGEAVGSGSPFARF